MKIRISAYVVAMALMLTLSVAMADTQTVYTGSTGNEFDAQMWEQLTKPGEATSFTTGNVDLLDTEFSLSGDGSVTPDASLPLSVLPEPTPQIPEPTTLLLIGAGLLGLAAGKRFRQ